MTHAPHTPQPTVAATIAALGGRQVIADRIGVQPTAVSRAASLDRFPAMWYVAIREMCAAADLPAPDEALFTFKLPEDHA